MTDSTNPLARLFEEAKRSQEALDALYVTLRDGGYMSRVTLVKYRCKSKEACALATVYGIGEHIHCATSDYKYSPGMNEGRSVASARAKNTLDGDKHWPGHVFDVRDLADWGTVAGMSIVCRHTNATLIAVEVLGVVRGVIPGRPIKPIRV